MEHAIEGLLDTAMSNIKSMVNVNTVIGDAITGADGTIIIPISTVSFGFGAGGSDFAPKSGSAISEKMFGGGCGGGANVSPTGFLVVTGGNVRYIQTNTSSDALNKVIDLMPNMVDKINSLFSGKKKKKDNNQTNDSKSDNTEKIEIID